MNVPAHVQAKIKRYDSALNLRWAGDRFALERRGQDGRYTRIGSVAPELLGDGSMLLSKLHRNDLWKQGDREVGKNAQLVGSQIDNEEFAAEQKRKAQRKEYWIDRAKEDHDSLKLRFGSRIFNAGMPA